jgi:hypothetical protein
MRRLEDSIARRRGEHSYRRFAPNRTIDILRAGMFVGRKFRICYVAPSAVGHPAYQALHMEMAYVAFISTRVPPAPKFRTGERFAF